MSDSSGRRSRGLGILPPAAAALLLTACTNNAYMGISLTDGAGDPALRSLAQRASAGEKQAQLDLGIRYEEGRGVVPDFAKARRLYRLAASDSGGAVWVYVPSVRNGQQGRVVKISDSIRQLGSPEARERLERLERLRAASRDNAECYGVKEGRE